MFPLIFNDNVLLLSISIVAFCSTVPRRRKPEFDFFTRTLFIQTSVLLVLISSSIAR
jgi:hypothetical protein